MPYPFALCMEDLDPAVDDARFLRCVALPGRQPGLRVLSDGSLGWQFAGAIACELCVSADERLILFRPEGAPSVLLDRAGRVLDVPFERPVVLLSQDVIEVGSRRMRVHIHGLATKVAPPSRLPSRRHVAAHTAAIVALGAAVLACDKPVEVRETPPLVAEDPSGAPPPPRAADATIPDISTSSTKPASGTPSSDNPEPSASVPDRPKPASKPPGPPIEVRDSPPRAD
jgi:hypothetical protein